MSLEALGCVRGQPGMGKCLRNFSAVVVFIVWTPFFPEDNYTLSF